MPSIGPHTRHLPFSVAVLWETPPGRPPIRDPFDYALTWGTVSTAHTALTRHAFCSMGSYESDPDNPGAGSETCPCQWHPAMIEQLADYRAICMSWPGPICGSCWRASCSVCGYTLASVTDAAGRDAHGRLVCHGPSCAHAIAPPA